MKRHATALSRLFRTFDFMEKGLGPVLDLAIRWWLAAIFWVSGVLKVTNWQGALELARSEYPVPWMDPVTAAWSGAAIELVCPVFLALGLATRLAALPMLALSLVIQVYYKELPDHVFWAILLGWLVVRGPGALSLDALIAPAIRRTALPLVEPAADLVAALTRYATPVYQLFLRAWMAAIFWSSGLTKIASWETTVALFQEEYRVPVLPPGVAAALATSAELACPVLLVLGLGARLASLPLVAMTLVIQFTYLDRAEHFYWMMTLGLIALRGPGLLSADALIRRWALRLVPGFDGTLPPDSDAWPRVVIVGAGFGGIETARTLRHSPVRVTVIDRRNHHLFQPLLYQVATAALSPADIATPIREILRDHANTSVLMGRVTGADTTARTVRIEREGMAPRDVPYDFLVLATGARHSYFGRDDWEKYAPGLKKIDDATAIRRRILLAFEQAEGTDDPVERARLLTFVIVGAGPTGVELAGAIAELARFGLTREFRGFDPAAARVVLVQSGDRVLPVFPEALSASAQAALERLGVEVRLKGKVGHVDDRGVVVDNQRIEAGTILWAAGVVASAAAKWIGAETDRAGRIRVLPDLSVPRLPEVFALGDTALATDDYGNPVPGLAPAAKQGGVHVGRAIHARVTGGSTPGPFRYRHRGSLATIGRKAAIADFGGLRLTGMLAWWLWGIVHVAFLAGARNRLSVAVEWSWAYLTLRRGIRLITGQGQG